GRNSGSRMAHWASVRSMHSICSVLDYLSTLPWAESVYETTSSISLRAALAGDPLNNILVEPRDHIVVHRQPERVNPASAYVRGEVARPGRYPLAPGMRVSDLIRSAGGLLRSANPAGADLVHYAMLDGAAAQPSGELAVNLSITTSVLSRQTSPGTSCEVFSLHL
ncbi:MAG: SLBB domain-containing protein, partial [Candidatus Acidiferrum sp.]